MIGWSPVSAVAAPCLARMGCQHVLYLIQALKQPKYVEKLEKWVKPSKTQLVVWNQHKYKTLEFFLLELNRHSCQRNKKFAYISSSVKVSILFQPTVTWQTKEL